MRYYSITLTNPTTGQSLVPDASGGFTTGSGPTFTSLYRNPITRQTLTDPGALNIELTSPQASFANFKGATQLKIWGVGLKMIGQAANLAGYNITIKAGMAPGLPLANPAQAGVILQGNVFQAYGNWSGVNQTLDLILNPGVNSSLLSVPVPFWWPAGTPLSDAIDNALSQCFPQCKHQVFIDANLRLANDEAGYYETFAQFASFIKGLTLKIGSQTFPNYHGVDITWAGDTIFVFDGQSGGPSSITVPLDFTDLIGQPTWIGPASINFSTVLRADISAGNRIKFPTTPAGAPVIALPFAIISPPAAVPGQNVPSRSSTAFQGEFVVNYLQHFANFRDPDADSWSTSINATAVPK